MTDKYYEILGVDKNATLADIKKAYRRKAKFLHPDANQSPDAHEKFILLSEAYEYFQNLKTGKIYSQKGQSYKRPEKRDKTKQDWHQKEREKVRQRAREHAGMEYWAFTKTNFYKTTVALHVLADFFSVLTVLFIFIGAPLIGYWVKGIGGLVGGFFIIFLTVHYWADIVIHNRPELNFKELGPALVRVLKTRTFKLLLATAINLFLLCHIGFRTLISVWTLAIIFTVAIAGGILVSARLKYQHHKKTVYLSVAPGLVNLFLLLNFLFSTDDRLETYSFKHELQPSDSGWQKTSHIILQDDQYSDYIGIRLFVDYESMKSAKTITYNFEDGLFGIRVVKSYKFK